MPRPSPRLNTYSSVAVRPPFMVSDGEWGRLGRLLSPPTVPKSAREEIEEACDDYLRGREAELNAGPVSSAKARIERMREQADGFASLAQGLHDYSTDEAAAVSSAVRRATKGMRARVGSLDVCGSQSEEWGREEIPPGVAFGIRPDPALLVDLSRLLQQAIAAASQDISCLEEGRGGFERGKALSAWVLRLRQILRDHNEQATTAKRDGLSGLSGGVTPTPFAHFVWGLLSLMPSDLRDPISGPKIMGQRIKDAIAEERSLGVR